MSDDTNADWPAGVHMVRGVMSVPLLLVDPEGAVLIDTGFPGDAPRIRHRMEKLRLGPENLRAILLTHGHIDHAGCAATIKTWSGAPLYAHPLDQPHIDGTFPYTGMARVCGGLERAGRAVTGYERTSIDVPLAEGDLLPFWGGLRVIHLPGHTVGHCGFYSERHGVLFSGDLWVRFMMRTQVSPRIFTDAPGLVWPSMRKARAIGARWIIPGHFDFPDATRLRRRFEELCEEHDRRSWAPVV
jgi:glyoxylase-like metal-dependent hydrolase (beta-lactamase superfamily II)